MTRDRNIYRLAYWMAAFIVAAVLLSGYHKIMYPGEFAVSVYRFNLLPDALINFTALYLPWLEFVCAVGMLFVPRLRPVCLWIVLVLLIGFTAGIGFNLWRGSVFGCGCFGRGAGDAPLNGIHLVRNLALITVILLGMVARKRLARED